MLPPSLPQPLRRHHLHGTIDVWLGAAGHSLSLTPQGFSRCAGVQDRTERKAGHQESQPSVEMAGPADQAIHDRQQQENGSRAPKRPRRVPSPLSLSLSTRVPTPTRRDLLFPPSRGGDEVSRSNRVLESRDRAPLLPSIPHAHHHYHRADHPPTPTLSMTARRMGRERNSHPAIKNTRAGRGTR
jgi:hypothetical protein